MIHNGIYTPKLCDISHLPTSAQGAISSKNNLLLFSSVFVSSKKPSIANGMEMPFSIHSNLDLGCSTCYSFISWPFVIHCLPLETAVCLIFFRRVPRRESILSSFVHFASQNCSWQESTDHPRKTAIRWLHSPHHRVCDGLFSHTGVMEQEL